MDLEKFDKIPEIFKNSKESLEKVLGTKLTFHEKPGVPETWQISGLLNENGERFLLALNSHDGKYSSSITLVVNENTNVLMSDPKKGIELAQKLEDMLEILVEIY